MCWLPFYLLTNHNQPFDVQAIQSRRNVCRGYLMCRVACPDTEWLQAAMFFCFSYIFLKSVYLSPPWLSSCQSAVTCNCCQWACLYHTPYLMLLICCQLKSQIIKTSEIAFTLSGELSTWWRFCDRTYSSLLCFYICCVMVRRYTTSLDLCAFIHKMRNRMGCLCVSSKERGRQKRKSSLSKFENYQKKIQKRNSWELTKCRINITFKMILLAIIFLNSESISLKLPSLYVRMILTMCNRTVLSLHFNLGFFLL